MEMYQIVFIIVVVCTAALYLVQRFTGVNYVYMIVQWKPVQAAITTLVKAVSNILPSPYFKTIVIVLEAAGEGTETAEELWKLGELPKDERNDYAKKIAADVLSKAGIEITEQIQMIINGSIEMVCMLMPHGVVPYNQETRPEREAEGNC